MLRDLGDWGVEELEWWEERGGGWILGLYDRIGLELGDTDTRSVELLSTFGAVLLSSCYLFSLGVSRC